MSFGICQRKKLNPTNSLFSFPGPTGAVEVRTYPCFCEDCIAENYGECTRQEYVGTFERQTMKPKDMRVPTTRYNSISREVLEGGDHFEVEAIKGSRHFESKYQYEVKWAGYDETTWIDADKLACYDLIEEYEIKST
jgi:hypothetical protein